MQICSVSKRLISRKNGLKLLEKSNYDFGIFKYTKLNYKDIESDQKIGEKTYLTLGKGKWGMTSRSWDNYENGFSRRFRKTLLGNLYFALSDKAKQPSQRLGGSKPVTGMNQFHLTATLKKFIITKMKYSILKISDPDSHGFFHRKLDRIDFGINKGLVEKSNSIK